MTNKLIKLNDGLTIDLEINRVILTPLFNKYDPFTNKPYSHIELNSDIHFDFEENDEGEFVCVAHNADSPKPIFNSEEISALEKDLAIIFNAISNGFGFALKNLFAFRWESALEIAKDMGYRNGKNSGEWIAMESFGGRCRDIDVIPNAKRILKMADDGDSAFYEMIPSTPLSGEWADDISAREVICDSLKISEGDFSDLQQIAEWLEMSDEFNSLTEHICSTFEESYSDACQNEIIRQAKLTIAE